MHQFLYFVVWWKNTNLNKSESTFIPAICLFVKRTSKSHSRGSRGQLKSVDLETWPVVNGFESVEYVQIASVLTLKIKGPCPRKVADNVRLKRKERLLKICNRTNKTEVDLEQTTVLLVSSWQNDLSLRFLRRFGMRDAQFTSLLPSASKISKWVPSKKCVVQRDLYV